MLQNTKIIIIGAGLSGLYFANLCYKNNIDFEVYEKSSAPTDVGGGLDMRGNGIKALKQVLPDESLNEYLALIEKKVEGTPDHFFRQSQSLIELSQEVENIFFPIERARLRDWLLEPIRDHVHYGYRFESIVKNETDQVVIHLSHQGHSVQVSATYLIGADGVGSGVRNSLFPSAPKTYTGLLWAGGLFDKAHLPESLNRTLIKLSREGQVWGIRPTLTGAYWFYVFKACESSVERYASLSSLIEEKLKTEDTQLRELLQRTNEASYFIVKTYRKLPAHAFGSGNIFLIGDAIRTMSPILGQNTSQGMEDAYQLMALLRTCLSSDTDKIQKAYFQGRYAHSKALCEVDQQKVENLLSSQEHHILDKLKQSPKPISVSMNYMTQIIKSGEQLVNSVISRPV